MRTGPSQSAASCALLADTLVLARDRGDSFADPNNLGPGSVEHLRTCRDCRDRFRAAARDSLPVIPHYTLIRPLGHGGFGQVFQAIHHDKERIEAIKLATRRSDRGTANLANEVHLAASLRHPHIATLYDAKLDSDPPYYAMEYVEGEHLDDYLAQTPLSLAATLRLFEKIVAAVQYAHERGVIHRDLKPRNILMTRDGEPRIVDFGIGRQMPGPSHASGQARPRGSDTGDSGAGTPGYMAPEQVFGHSSDARSDIYSLGVILLNSLLATTEVPTHGELRRAFAARKFPRPSDLAAIVTKCTQTDPGLRYRDCAAAARDVRAYLRADAIAARAKGGLRYRVRRSLTSLLQNQPRSVAFAICVALLSGLTGLFWNSNTRMSAAAAISTARPPVVLVTLDDSTRASIAAGEFAAIAPRCDPTERRSWRALHAALQRQLSEAGARCVTWDYFFPRCHAETDGEFAAALAAETPAVVGAAQFDEAARPEICESLRDSAWGIGAILGLALRQAECDVAINLAIRRGNAPPIPSLSVAAFGTSRFRGYRPHFSVVPGGVEIRYEAIHPSADRPKWHRQSDFLSATEADGGGEAEWLRPGDRVLMNRIPVESVRSPRRIERRSYAEILRLSSEERNAIFRERSVLVAQTEAGADEHPWLNGTTVFGCEVQAAALASLLTASLSQRLMPAALAWRVALGLTGAALLAAMLRRAGPHRIANAAGLCSLAALLAFGASVTASRISGAWAVNTLVITTSLAIGFCLLHALQIIRRRAGGDALIATGPPLGGTTLSDRHLRTTSTLAHRPTPH